MPHSPAFNFTATGAGKETTFRCGGGADVWLSATDITMTVTNSWLMRNSARNQVGREEPDTGVFGGSGSFTIEADPDVIIPLLAYAMGTEAVATNIAVGNGPGTVASTTLTAAAPAGSTTLQVASATGFSVNYPPVLDPLFTNSEAAPISAISGTTITLTAPLKYAHKSGATLQATTAYDHTLVFGIPRPTFSVQFNRKTDVVTYTGNKVRSFSISLSPQQLLNIGFQTTYQNSAIAVAGTPNFSRIHPFRVIDPGNTLLVNGAASPCGILSMTINVTNGLGATEYTLANGRLINNIPEITASVSGSMNLQFTSDYYQQLFWGNAGATTTASIVQGVSIALTLLSPMWINGVVRYGLQVIMNNCRISTAPTAGRAGSLLTQTVTFEAFETLPGANDDILLIGTSAATAAA